MENIKQIIAQNLLTLRKSKKLTQAELAEKINYSDKAISRWEHAETLPDIETLCKLCEFYGVRFEYLLQEEQPPERQNPYIIRTDEGNRIAICLIGIVTVWLIAIVAFFYGNLYERANAWTYFIWALPISSTVVYFYNRYLLRNKFVKYAALSFSMWTTILSLYLQWLDSNLWLLFVIGVPMQTLIVLFATLKRPIRSLRDADSSNFKFRQRK